MMTTDPRYPIGQYEPQPYSEEQKNKWLLDIHFLPEELERAVMNLDEAQLHTPYRDGGWTVHQLVHHVADSHINAYCRCKLALTETNPVIKPYEETAWALLDDVKELPVNISLTLLHALHRRWHASLKNCTPEQWERKVYHPESKKEMSLWFLLGLYAWHGKHHTTHITALREQKNWI